MAQWLEHRTVVEFRQGTAAGQVASRGRVRGNHKLIFLTLSFSLSSLLYLSKILKKKKKKEIYLRLNTPGRPLNPPNSQLYTQSFWTWSCEWTKLGLNLQQSLLPPPTNTVGVPFPHIFPGGYPWGEGLRTCLIPLLRLLCSCWFNSIFGTPKAL